MRTKAWQSAAFLLALMFGSVACEKYVTKPVTRRPVISSVVAFPTLLGPGDSTLVTIYATDPDGDPLVYDWEPYNGLYIESSTHVGNNDRFNTSSRSMVFYRSTTFPYAIDTAFVFCSVRDGKGGGDTRQVLILYKN